MADQLLAAVKEFDPNLGPKYNKFYIGLATNGEPTNFVIFRPKKDWLRVAQSAISVMHLIWGANQRLAAPFVLVARPRARGSLFPRLCSTEVEDYP